MATHRAHVAAVASGCSSVLLLLLLLLPDSCAAANPVAPVPAQSFAVDITDEDFAGIQVASAGSVGVAMACTGPASTQVVVQVIGGSGKAKNPLEQPACFTYDNVTHKLLLDLEAAGCVEAGASVSVQVSLTPRVFAIDVAITTSVGDTAMSLCDAGIIPRVNTVFVTSTSGNIKVENVVALGNASFTSKSGAVTLSNVAGSFLTATTAGHLTTSNTTSFNTSRVAWTPLVLHGGDVTVSGDVLGFSVKIQATGAARVWYGGLRGLCGVSITATGDVDFMFGVVQGVSVSVTSTSGNTSIDSTLVMLEPPPPSYSGCATPRLAEVAVLAPNGSKRSRGMVVTTSDEASGCGSRVWEALRSRMAPVHSRMAP